MIRVDRERVSPPSLLRSPAAKAATRRLEPFFAKDPKARHPALDRFLREMRQP